MVIEYKGGPLVDTQAELLCIRRDASFRLTEAETKAYDLACEVIMLHDLGYGY